MTAAQAWGAVWAAATERLPGNVVELWIGCLEVVGLSAGRLVLSVPDDRFLYLQRRYGRLLGQLTREVTDLDGVVLRRRVHRPDPRRHAGRAA